MKKRKKSDFIAAQMPISTGFVGARMPADIAAQIYEACQKETISMSLFLRQAVERELKRLQRRA